MISYAELSTRLVTAGAVAISHADVSTCPERDAIEVIVRSETRDLHWLSHQRPLPTPGLMKAMSCMTRLPFDGFDRLLDKLGIPLSFTGDLRRANLRQVKRLDAYALWQVDNQMVHIDNRLHGLPDWGLGYDELHAWLDNPASTVEVSKLQTGDIIAFDPQSLHAVHNPTPMLSLGIHTMVDDRREVVVYVALGDAKSICLFPAMPRRAQEFIDDLGVPTTPALAEGGRAGVDELRRLVAELRPEPQVEADQVD